MATGIVLTCAGGAAVLAGLVIGLEGADFSGLGGGSGDPFPPASIAALIGGFVGLAVGIPTTIIGGRRVPKNRSSAEAGPLLLVGPKGASLRVLF